MIMIDGAQGEGGGQVLRTALSLSIAMGQPFTIENIRARRSKPGLMRQHLTAVTAAAEICGGRAVGAEIGGQRLRFEPGAAKAGDYHFRIGTAGSTTLVLQTILLPLAQAGAPSRVVIEGGTHNPSAPPFDFLQHAFLPLLRRIGFNVTAMLKRPGFYPAGGGAIEIEIGTADAFAPLVLDKRGALRSRRAEAVIANLPRQIAERELAVLAQRLDLKPEELCVRHEPNASGPGNCVLVIVQYDNLCEVATSFGQVNISSEAVAEEAARQIRSYIAADTTVGSYLADQLILPMAVAAGGRFNTAAPSQHLLTNADVINRFRKNAVVIESDLDHRYRINVSQQYRSGPIH
jgi:RNA 3'-terminal phosphate cyclase (ATP)